MAQRKTKFIKGNYYHIYNRGTNRELIFKSDNNYIFLLKRFGHLAQEMQIAVIAYCLMPNHYHFLLRQDSDIEISQLLQGTFNSYTKAFNKMYERMGTLFEGRFKSIHIDNENYLIHLCRYIHKNPYEAGLISNIKDWPYSNYLEWIGKRNGKLIDKAFVSANFESPDFYKNFVLELSNNTPNGLNRYFLV